MCLKGTECIRHNFPLFLCCNTLPTQSWERMHNSQNSDIEHIIKHVSIDNSLRNRQNKLSIPDSLIGSPQTQLGIDHKLAVM